MTIAMDDVSSLFHVCIACNFFTVSVMNQEIAYMIIEKFLGITPGLVLDEFTGCSLPSLLALGHVSEYDKALYVRGQ